MSEQALHLHRRHKSLHRQKKFFSLLGLALMAISFFAKEVWLDSVRERSNSTTAARNHLIASKDSETSAAKNDFLIEQSQLQADRSTSPTGQYNLRDMALLYFHDTPAVRRQMLRIKQFLLEDPEANDPEAQRTLANAGKYLASVDALEVRATMPAPGTTVNSYLLEALQTVPTKDSVSKSMNELEGKLTMEANTSIKKLKFQQSLANWSLVGAFLAGGILNLIFILRDIDIRVGDG
jgi:hypothetical protein